MNNVFLLVFFFCCWYKSCLFSILSCQSGKSDSSESDTSHEDSVLELVVSSEWSSQDVEFLEEALQKDCRVFLIYVMYMHLIYSNEPIFVQQWKIQIPQIGLVCGRVIVSVIRVIYMKDRHYTLRISRQMTGISIRIWWHHSY